MLAKRPLLMCLIALTLNGLTSACTLKEPSLHVFAAASLSDVMLEIKDDFEKEKLGILELSFASSNALARQIEASSYADVFFSADPLLTKSLKSQSRQDKFMHVPLVLIQNARATQKISHPKELTNAQISKFIVGEPSSVPVGRYAQEALGTLYAELDSKRVTAPDARAVLRMVEASQDAAGIVYATDAASSARVRVAYVFPPEYSAYYSWISLLKERNQSTDKSLRSLESFLKSDDAKKYFQRRGFIFDG